MKKRLCAFFLTWMFLAAMVAVPARASDNNRTVDAYCEHCKSEQTWYALTESADKMTEGHYFLGFDGKALAFSEQKISKSVCLLLDDKEFIGNRRITVQNGGTLSVQGSGKLSGRGADGFGPGGAVLVQEGGTLNLYSGTLTYKVHQTANRGATNGGVVAVEGTFNLYGGIVTAGVARDLGGSIYVGKTGIANLYGGTVSAGTATTGNCIYNTGKVLVAGDAKVEELLQVPVTDGPALGEMLIVQGIYTGKTMLKTDAQLSDGADIGDTAGADISGGTLQLLDSELWVKLQNDQIVAYLPEPVWNATTGAEYATLTQAIADAQAGQKIALRQGITESATVDKNLTLDLAGRKLEGTLTAAPWVTVYVMDTQTADYTITDGICGSITTVAGDVVGAPATADHDAYMKLTGADGVSFHAVGLDIAAMSLRPADVGLYYTGKFQGDGKVTESVESYGVALNVYEDPVKNEESTLYTVFDGASFNTQPEGTSSLVKGIMKPENTDMENAVNAGKTIYSRAYARLSDGSILYGNLCERSLVEQIKDVDRQWKNLVYQKKNGVLNMYTAYMQVMDAWDVPNINDYLTEEEETLKILSIGQSHSQDSVWLVQEVLQTERPDEKFFVAECIKSVTMVDHVKNAKNDAHVYTYYTNTEGKWDENDNWSIREALLDQRWDIVVINESSRYLGREDVMVKGYVNEMVDFVTKTLSYDTKLLYNWTWTTPTDQTFHDPNYDPQPSATFWSNFVKDYQADRKVHYESMRAMLEKYVEPIEEIDGILYSATPIQYATEVLGVSQVDMYRDYIHLSDYGRLYIGYLWYAQIYGLDHIDAVHVDVIEAHLRQWRWVSKGDVVLTQQMKDWIVESVNYALQHPKQMPEGK